MKLFDPPEAVLRRSLFWRAQPEWRELAQKNQKSADASPSDERVEELAATLGTRTDDPERDGLATVFQPCDGIPSAGTRGTLGTAGVAFLDRVRDPEELSSGTSFQDRVHFPSELPDQHGRTRGRGSREDFEQAPFEKHVGIEPRNLRPELECRSLETA